MYEKNCSLTEFHFIIMRSGRHPDFIYCYKMVFGLVKLDFCDFFEFFVSSTRGHA